MKTRDLKNNKWELTLFVIFVLLVSWTPMILTVPLPQGVIDAQRLDEPTSLFPNVAGYSLSLIPQKEAAVSLGARYGAEKEGVSTIVWMHRIRGGDDLRALMSSSFGDDWDLKSEVTSEIEDTAFSFLEVEKDGEKKVVAYWNLIVVEKKPRVFIFTSSPEDNDILFITLETQADENSRRRIEEIGEALINHIS